MLYLDSTVLNVALPSIQRNFDASVAGLQWIVDGFLIGVTSLLLISGSIADRFGRRRMFHVGLITFCLSSLLCSLSVNAAMLVSFRLLQAVGGSMLVPTTLSIIRNTFTDPGERARALGIWSGIFGVAAAAGPIIGGLLVDFVGWRSIFWVNVPIGALALWLSFRFVPESQAPLARRFDLPGQLLAIAFLVTLTYSLIEAPNNGWSSTTTLALFALSALLCLVFIQLEKRREAPLLEVHFFANRAFSGAISTAILAYTVFIGFLFLSTLYLQDVRGDSALVAGTAMLPTMIVITIGGPLAGRYVANHGTRRLLVGSGLATAVGMLLLCTVTPSTSFLFLALAYAFVGLGIGIVNPPVTATAVSGMPATQAGVASAVTSTSRQLGSVLGVAVMGSLAATGFHSSLASHLVAQQVPIAQRQLLLQGNISGLAASTSRSPALHQAVVMSFSNALHLCWLVGAFCCLLWSVITLLLTRTVTRRRSEDPAPSRDPYRLLEQSPG